MQPSAEILRVECAKCRRERDLPAARATLCGDRACRVREMQARVRAQPSAEIVRVECAKCRRECDSSGARATLWGDRACRVREMQARVRFVRRSRNPLGRSRASSARNAGESAMRPVPAQRLCACGVREMQARVRFVQCARNPSLECAQRRRECDLSGTRATLCGDCACRAREIQARVRFAGCPRNPLRRSRECAKCRRERERVCTRATLCGDRACRARSAGDFVVLVQL